MKRSSGKTKRRADSSQTHKVKRLTQATSSGSTRPTIGSEATVEMRVPFEWTIQRYDAALPAVLSTPAMIGMMEMAAARAVKDELPPGSITVGTRIEVDHLKAVTVGAMVRACAKLTDYKDRFLVFEAEARSGKELIGRGLVFRAIVEPVRFHSKAETNS